MGAFICQISERDWPVSRKLGIYGNRINKPDSHQKLRNQDRLSVIRDLIGIKEGDLIFFHVIRSQRQSTIHGVYKARSKPFFDETKIWDDRYDTFPHRFLFEPHEDFEDLCLFDSCINVSELYAKIEQRKIWSQATLENERNIERRAVRKISNEDAEEIIKLILRDFSADKKDKYKTELIDKMKEAKDLRIKIDSIGNIENAIKALLMYELREKTKFVEDIFGNTIDFMNEVFVAQTTRKLFDILVISKNKEARTYFIIEVKTDRFHTYELSQLLRYLDLFRQREIFNIKNDNIEGCILAKRIDTNVVEFVSLYNKLGVFDKIIMITYEPRNSGKEAIFKIQRDITQVTAEFPKGASAFNFKLNYDDITEKTISSLPIFRVLPNISRTILKKNEVKKLFILEEDQLKADGTREKFGYVFLRFFKNKLEWNGLKEFMQDMKEFVEESDEKDYMETCPTIITPKVEDEALRFINLYNTYQRRKAIKLFLTEL